jgi:hypothetical protein
MILNDFISYTIITAFIIVTTISVIRGFYKLFNGLK